MVPFATWPCGKMTTSWPPAGKNLWLDFYRSFLQPNGEIKKWWKMLKWGMATERWRSRTSTLATQFPPRPNVPLQVENLQESHGWNFRLLEASVTLQLFVSHWLSPHYIAKLTRCSEVGVSPFFLCASDLASPKNCCDCWLLHSVLQSKWPLIQMTELTLESMAGLKNLQLPSKKLNLVGGSATPLKNMSSSIGMMTFPIYGKIKSMATKPPTRNSPVRLNPK